MDAEWHASCSLIEKTLQCSVSLRKLQEDARMDGEPKQEDL